MVDNVYSGEGLEKALAEGSFSSATTMASSGPLVGMVKQAAGPGSISFLLQGCESWVDVPIVLIERAEHIGLQHWRDYSHPVMRITLKTTDDPATEILSALLRAMTPGAGVTGMTGQLQMSAPAPIGTPGAGSNGFIFCFPECIERSKLFPNICNRWVWRCAGGPIIFFPPIFF